MTTDRQDSLKVHRREVRGQIILPFLGGLLLIIGLVVIMVLLGRTPTSAVANTLLTILILCPLALCLLPIYLLLAVAVAGVNSAHGSLGKPLHRLEDLSITVRDRTYEVTDQIARASINLNTRFAALDKLIFSRFDPPPQVVEQEEEKEEEEEHEQPASPE
jgi:hypothetical protein